MFGTRTARQGLQVGLTKEDIGRQIEAAYGVNPVPYLPPPPTKVEKVRRCTEFKKTSMEMNSSKKMLKSLPADMARSIPVDARGEPV